MSVFKDRNVTKVCIAYVLMTVALFILTGIRGAICGLAFFVIFLVYSIHQKKKISQINEKIDHILHGDELYDLTQYTEGELAVLENEIRKMTIRLSEQADALTKDKLYLAESVANISHQIRTPLTSINLVVSFLNDDNLSVDRRKEIVRQLEKYLEQIDWLVTTLMKISKLDTGTVAFCQDAVEVNELIKKVVSPFEILMDIRNIKLETLIDSDVQFIGDFSWTVEALENIIKNCLEHMEDGGLLQIVGKNTPIYTEIIITDNGCGFGEEDLSHVFERFYRGHNAKDGNFGIGLALARMIIKEQNGTIRAQNRKDTKGAQFIIKLYKGTL